MARDIQSMSKDDVQLVLDNMQALDPTMDRGAVESALKANIKSAKAAATRAKTKAAKAEEEKRRTEYLEAQEERRLWKLSQSPAAIREARKNKTITKPDGNTFHFDHNGQKSYVWRVNRREEISTDEFHEYERGYDVILPMEEIWENGVLVEENYFEDDVLLIAEIKTFDDPDKQWSFTTKSGRTFYRRPWSRPWWEEKEYVGWNTGW